MGRILNGPPIYVFYSGCQKKVPIAGRFFATTLMPPSFFRNIIMIIGIEYFCFFPALCYNYGSIAINDKLQRKIVMRGVLIIGMVVVLLIIGILVMKNMGVDNRSGVIETQTKQYTESAKSIADEANERTNDLREKMNRAGNN